MTIRYLKQYDYHSCGPTAIINAMKFKGLAASYRSDFKRIKTECKCTTSGVWRCDFEPVLKKYMKKITYIKNPSIKTIDKFLDKDKAVIIAYYYTKLNGEEEGHYVLCISRTDNYYKLINDTDNRNGEIRKNVVSPVSRKSMIKKLRYKNASEIWVI